MHDVVGEVEPDDVVPVGRGADNVVARQVVGKCAIEGWLYLLDFLRAGERR